jgi:signal transduction histidine kinase
MNLKTRILLILTLASTLSAVITGVVLVSLFKLHGLIPVEGGEGPFLAGMAIALYLIGGLVVLFLLNFLLSKAAIMPAVEREMLDNERSMLSEQLHHSQKMEAVGRLAGSIAHDFNNLLTIIDGYASLIISDPAGEETGNHAKEVVEAARKASFITRKLLGFSQKEQSEPVVLDLNTTMQDTDKMLNRLIGEKIQLITRAAGKPIFVRADPVQLGQVLMNLAVNARDAMPNGGRITIKTSCKQVDDGECRKPGTLPAGEYACITVRDTGQGMTAETLERIFEPFFTTKQAGKGTGLGLSIVKDIVKQNKGFIDLHSKPGAGSTFFIYLPVTQVAEEIAKEGEALVSKPAIETSSGEKTEEKRPEKSGSKRDGHAATIMLVEDDPMIRTLVSHTLEGEGYNVILSDDGWQAIQVARKHEREIDLLFTDVVMPGLGGAELAVAMREIHPDIKALFMSGYSRSQVTEEGVPPDAPLLEKPFTPDKVIAMVHDLLN